MLLTTALNPKAALFFVACPSSAAKGGSLLLDVSDPGRRSAWAAFSEGCNNKEPLG
ncbi:hypothetical protein [Nonomuraea sp. bgisy101]|uniref:hypothetical protein n=1 Tax=Nonomuraea sp. bgisy101 TaxID=3413784 RepID=UPI003D728058